MKTYFFLFNYDDRRRAYPFRNLKKYVVSWIFLDVHSRAVHLIIVDRVELQRRSGTVPNAEQSTI